MSRTMRDLDVSYYSAKAAVLADIFGANHVEVERSVVVVDGARFPIVDDVVVLLPPDRYPRHVIESIDNPTSLRPEANTPFAADIQYTFGQEWQTYGDILGEHESEFQDYFDLIDVESLDQTSVCALGGGSGPRIYSLLHTSPLLIPANFLHH